MPKHHDKRESDRAAWRTVKGGSATDFKKENLQARYARRAQKNKCKQAG